MNCQLVFSALRSKADIMESGRTYHHVNNHGYTPSDKNLTNQLSKEINKKFSGYVMRCGFEDSVWDTIKLAADANQKTGMKSSIHLRLSADNPAEKMTSESFICKRLAEAMIYGWLHNIDSIYCDTLATNDRGYFPREGVLDRLYNPKTSFYRVKNLHAFLSSIDSQALDVKTINPKTIEFSEDDGHTLLRAKLKDDELTLLISTSAVWLTKEMAKALAQTNNELLRLNWFTGALDVLTPALFIDNKSNDVGTLRIEIFISKA